MWVGSASAADHVRRDGHGVGRGVAGSGVAARPRPCPALAATRRGPKGERAAGGVGGGGGCTGWRYVVEEITAAGFEAHVAEPADTQAARGRKRHAKTDRSDARLLRELLQRGDLPESWIPPSIVLEWWERVRLYKSLVDQRLVWTQRIHAELFQHGVAVPEAQIRSTAPRAWLAGDDVTLTPAARQRVRVGYRMIDASDAEASPLKEQLQRFGMRQPACRALVEHHYGIGGVLAGGGGGGPGGGRAFFPPRPGGGPPRGGGPGGPARLPPAP